MGLGYFSFNAHIRFFEFQSVIDSMYKGPRSGSLVDNFFNRFRMALRILRYCQVENYFLTVLGWLREVLRESRQLQKICAARGLYHYKDPFS